MRTKTIFREERSSSSSAQAAGLVMFAFILANLVGLLRQVVINRAFGTSTALDAYFAAFRVPDLLFHVIAGGALGSAFIPYFTGLLSKGDRPGAWQLASAVLNWVLIASTVLAAIAAWLAPWMTQSYLAPGFTQEQVLLTVALMRIMLISTVLFGISGLLMGVHHSKQHFLSPALAPVLYNAGIIVGAMMLTTRWGVRGLAFGVLLGAGLHLTVQVPMLLRYQGQYRITLGLQNAAVRAVGRLMLPRALGMAVWQINFWVNTVIASGLPAGSLSALTIAFQVFTFPQAVIAQAIATAIFPTFSAQAARGETSAMRASLAASLRGALYLAIPASVGLWLLGKPIITMLFQNSTFSTESTEMVAWALRWYALGLISHCVVEIVTRAFYALKDTRTPVIIGLLTMLINVVLSLLLTVSFRAYGLLPHGGLALANTVATTLEMVALLWLLRPRLGGLSSVSTLKSVGRTTVGTAAMMLSLQLWIILAPPSVVILSLVGVPLGVAIFWGTTALIGSEQAFRLPALLKQHIKH